MQIILIGIGGFFGAISRYLIDKIITASQGGSFPLGILFINISGSFALGFFYTATIDRFDISPELRLMITVGFLGAYTTFSTFSFDSVKLIEDGEVGQALINILASVFGGLIALYLGILLARTFSA